MKITPNEIASVETIGILNNKPVKMLRTKGGFVIATGIPRGKKDEEALAAGSHGAVVKYNLEKQFPDFQPAMMKSEGFSEKVVVEKHSHFLSDDLRKSGYDIYSIQKGMVVNFHVTKHEVNVSTAKSLLQNDSLFVTPEAQMDPAFTRAMSAAISEKATACGVSKIGIGAK